MARHMSTLEILANNLKQADESVSDKMLITKMLMLLPVRSKYKHFLSAWESVMKDTSMRGNVSGFGWVSGRAWLHYSVNY